ncbi:hypothetical protein [Reyranella sp.]|jgi:hypothetical protein|uniref:hypothetical protein n=1 Tax=Reyranella sp. TaxID=1929291 RepID=UPI002F9258BF
MGRRFDLTYKDRALKVCVLPIDEAWEFWLCERGCRLVLGARLAIDDVLAAWRDGRGDPFLATCELIGTSLDRGEITLPEAAAGPLCET